MAQTETRVSVVCDAGPLIHLDEHFDPDIVRALRRYGIEVTTMVEAGLRTASDQAQLAFARTERRVLVTPGHFGYNDVQHHGRASHGDFTSQRPGGAR